MNHYAFSPILRCNASLLPLERFAPLIISAEQSEVVRNKLLYGLNIWQFCYRKARLKTRSRTFERESASIRPRIVAAKAVKRQAKS